MKKTKLILIISVLLLLPLTSLFAQGRSMENVDLMWVTWIGTIAALGFSLILSLLVLKKPQGDENMKNISRHVQEGALAYLKQQYKVVGIIFVILFVLLLIVSLGFGLLSPFVPFATITGGFFSGLAGFVGMTLATRANARTAAAAKESLNSGLRVAFSAGTVMSMSVVGLGLLNIALWWVLLRFVFKLPTAEIPPIMITFGMGASFMALFARLGGGIFTKAADVGADLVGKVEAGIPEDDPRNPATIADNVGDNVGDVAGMGADLFESYLGSIIATMALGSVASMGLPGISALQAIQVPVVVATIGVICSIIGTFLVRAKEDASQEALLGALRRGTYFTTAVIAVVSFLVIRFTIGPKFIGLWIAMIIGLIAGNVIGYFTEFYTSAHYKPTQRLSDESKTGAATIIIGGLSLGMISPFIPVLTVVIATLAAFFFSSGATSVSLGLYGIGLASVGMLSTLGITLATDAYGPIADNAGGIAEMTGQDPKVRERTDALDSLGNTTAATGKGFAIGSAALTALALLAGYGNKIVEALQTVELSEEFRNFFATLIDFNALGNKEILSDITIMNIDLLNPTILIGLFIGCVLPFIFSAMSMKAVGRAAGDMIEEVRRQFKEKKGILEGTEQPDYARCVAISTKGAQREMVFPSLVAIIAPIIVGILFGPFTVIALLAGTLITGFILAIMMANAGGAWDNAKKYIESGYLGGKGSEEHKAAVVGDTVGDPFKDTSGPSINILIKLMMMVSIVFVPVYTAINNVIIQIIQ
jgi:K(+)-stimulated pyrophosphate-energized sodium pump